MLNITEQDIKRKELLNTLHKANKLCSIVMEWRSKRNEYSYLLTEFLLEDFQALTCQIENTILIYENTKTINAFEGQAMNCLRDLADVLDYASEIDFSYKIKTKKDTQFLVERLQKFLVDSVSVLKISHIKKLDRGYK